MYSTEKRSDSTKWAQFPQGKPFSALLEDVAVAGCVQIFHLLNACHYATASTTYTGTTCVTQIHRPAERSGLLRLHSPTSYGVHCGQW